MRAIPLLTDWETMSPDVVAGVLAWDEDYRDFPGLQAFHIGDAHRPIAARRWKNIAGRQLKALSDSISAVEVTHETGLQDWRRQSLGLLPAGVFVWKDEFEPLYCRRYGPDRETLITESGAAMPEDEHARRVALCFEPFIPDAEIRRLVMEGFEQPPARVVPDLSARPVIVLPAGTESVHVSDIPRLIARALYPRLLAQGRLPAGSKELPEDDSERSRNVQLYVLEKQYHSESALAISKGVRGLTGGLVVRSRQTRSPFITGGDVTDAYATVDDFRLYVVRTYDVDVYMAGAEPRAGVLGHPVQEEPQTAPMLKQRAQENRILELLASRKHDPLNIPARRPGVRGAKSEIKTLALLEPALFTKKTFDTAWQRLRDDGRLVGGE